MGIEEKIELIKKHRKEKNFIESDRIRDELTKSGYHIEYKKNGDIFFFKWE